MWLASYGNMRGGGEGGMSIISNIAYTTVIHSIHADMKCGACTNHKAIPNQLPVSRTDQAEIVTRVVGKK